MTRLFPYLILPPLVALLEYHSIQFWTITATGAEWPGWFTVEFWAAWHAWGWAAALELGGLWCWMRSAREAGFDAFLATVGGGVITTGLCTAALLNVIAPGQQGAAYLAELQGQRDRAANTAVAAQQIVAETKPYSRLVDIQTQAQRRATDLDAKILEALRPGGSLAAAAQSSGAATLRRWLLGLSVIVGNLLVVAAARAMANGNGERKQQQLAADFTENTDDAAREATGKARRQALGGLEADRRPDRSALRSVLRLLVGWPKQNDGTRAAFQQPDPSAADGGEDLQRHGAGVTPRASADISPEYWVQVSDLLHQPALGANAAQLAKWATERDAYERERRLRADGAGAAEPANLRNFFALKPGEPLPETSAGMFTTVSETPETQAAQGVTGSAAAPETEPETEPETSAEADELPAREPVTARVRAARDALCTRLPMETWEARGIACGLNKRDMSLIKNHEELATKRLAQIAAGVLPDKATRIISERSLSTLEAWVGTAPAAAPGARVRAL